jgi:hypothetical protein
MGYKKGERLTDPAVLERLKKARVKALEVRRANAARRKKERDLAKLEQTKKAKETDAKLKALSEPTKPAEPVKDVEDTVKPPTMEVKSVPQTPPPPAPTPAPAPSPAKQPAVRRKKKKRVEFVESDSSSSSSEEEYVRRRRRKPKGVRRLKKTVDTMQAQLNVMQQERDALRRAALERQAKAAQAQKKRSAQDTALDALFARNYGRRR